jgi:hypothetical protein
MSMELKMKPAVVSGGQYVQSGAVVDMMQYQHQGYGVLQVNFFNQGNTFCTIRIGGVDIELAPGLGNQGSNLVIMMPSGFYDTTKYQIKFGNTATSGIMPETPKNNLKMTVMLTKINFDGKQR